MGTTRGPGVSHERTIAAEGYAVMLTLTAAVWFRFVHFGTPLGTPSPVCITDCPTRPLHVSDVPLINISRLTPSSSPRYRFLPKRAIARLPSTSTHTPPHCAP